MTDESTPARALIDAYKACARPSAAAEAQIWATLAAAERPAPPRRPAAPGRLGWFALAACLLLFAAWQLDLFRGFASGHVLQDMRSQAEYDAAPPPTSALTREPARPLEVSAPPIEAPEITSPEGHVQEDASIAPAPVEAPETTSPEGHVQEDTSAPPAEPRRGSRRDPRGQLDEPAGDGVLAEMALLQQARAALRDGRASEALQLLARHAEEFARGSLVEERQALRVLALCAAGEAARGEAEAEAFSRTYPRSTYAGRVRDACPKDMNEETSSQD